MARNEMYYTRTSIKSALSREMVQKIVTAYENADFDVINTNNGSKLRDIFAYSNDNVSEPNQEDILSFLNAQLKYEYICSKFGMSKFNSYNKETQKNIIKFIENDIKKNISNARPNALVLKSELFDKTLINENAVHILTINTDGKSLVRVTKAIFDELKKRGIPFEIELPNRENMSNGSTEPIKLHVSSEQLQFTINAVYAALDGYKSMIKPPHDMSAKVGTYMGYDSLLDVEGERESDKLGVAVVKAIDATIAELGSDVKIGEESVINFLKNADNQDKARVICLRKIKKVKPNIIDPILVNIARVVKEEKIDINLNDVYLSDIASSELNSIYGVYDEKIEVENTNEIEFKEEKKISKVIESLTEKGKETVESIKVGAHALTHPIDILSPNLIQAAISFDSKKDELVDNSVELEVDNISDLEVPNPTVTVVEPRKKQNEINEFAEETEENNYGILPSISFDDVLSEVVEDHIDDEIVRFDDLDDDEQSACAVISDTALMLAFGILSIV